MFWPYTGFKVFFPPMNRYRSPPRATAEKTTCNPINTSQYMYTSYDQNSSARIGGRKGAQKGRSSSFFFPPQNIFYSSHTNLLVTTVRYRETGTQYNFSLYRVPLPLFFILPVRVPLQNGVTKLASTYRNVSNKRQTIHQKKKRFAHTATVLVVRYTSDFLRFLSALPDGGVRRIYFRDGRNDSLK